MDAKGASIGSGCVAHGAGLIIGLLAVWAAAAFGGDWPPAVMIGLGATAAVLVAALAARMGVVDGEGARLYTRAGGSFFIAATRWPGNMLAALGVVARAFGLGRTTPGFVRLKLRTADGAGLAGVIETLSARPGLLVVDADAGSLLAHALDENAVDVDVLKTLERRVLGGAREAVS